MTDLVILWIYFGFVSCVCVVVLYVIGCWSVNVSCELKQCDEMFWKQCLLRDKVQKEDRRERRRRRRRRPCSLGTVNRCDMVPILVEWFWKEGRRQDWIWREQNNFERETPNRKKKWRKIKIKWDAKKLFFLLQGTSVLRENRFSKLTAFLFSFFSFTVALFRREWQVAYRTEMSTIMVTAPATCAPNTP